MCVRICLEGLYSQTVGLIPRESYSEAWLGRGAPKMFICIYLKVLPSLPWDTLRASTVDFSWINSWKHCKFESDLLMKLFLDLENAHAPFFRIPKQFFKMCLLVLHPWEILIQLVWGAAKHPLFQKPLRFLRYVQGSKTTALQKGKSSFLVLLVHSLMYKPHKLMSS